jgi:hypothetical protein
MKKIKVKITSSKKKVLYSFEVLKKEIDRIEFTL